MMRPRFPQKHLADLNRVARAPVLKLLTTGHHKCVENDKQTLLHEDPSVVEVS